jgi:hypothetical protein
MAHRMWFGVASLLLTALGLAMLVWPGYFLELRKRDVWYNKFDFYASIYKSKYAKTAILINGWGLVLGGGVMGWFVLAG